MPKHKVIFTGPPVADDGLIRALMGTDAKGLAERIRRGEYNHILAPEPEEGQAYEKDQKELAR